MEEIGVVRVLLIAHREYFTNKHIIIYLILYFMVSLILHSVFCFTIFFPIIMPFTQEEGFTEVTRDRKKR